MNKINIKPNDVDKYKFLTSDEKIKDNKFYIEIEETLSRMIRSGATVIGAGFCISTSDMVRTALAQRGIESKLVEVQTALTYLNTQPSVTSFIGYNNHANVNEVATHVVVVTTNTTPAFLIDASIQHRLPNGYQSIIEPVSHVVEDPSVLCKSAFSQTGMIATYQQKKNQIISYFHQESIIERIETDRKFKQDINQLKWLIYIAIAVASCSMLNILLKFIGYWP